MPPHRDDLRLYSEDALGPDGSVSGERLRYKSTNAAREAIELLITPYTFLSGASIVDRNRDARLPARSRGFC